MILSFRVAGRRVHILLLVANMSKLHVHVSLHTSTMMLRAAAPRRVFTSSAPRRSVIRSYEDSTATGFSDFRPPLLPVLLAIAGFYPFVHFGRILAQRGDRAAAMRQHNSVVRALGEALQADTRSLEIHRPQQAARWLQTYAATILSFMAAVHWGAATARYTRGAGKLAFLVSILPQLLAWSALNLSAEIVPPESASEQRLHVIPQWIRQHLNTHDPRDWTFPSANSALAVGFLMVFAQDMASVARGVNPLWYLTYRAGLTAGVVLALKAADQGLYEASPQPQLDHDEGAGRA